METIQTPYGNFTVYLNPLITPQGKLFHISFVDKKNQLYIIFMRQVANRWVFADPASLPGWIIELQSQFETLVSKQRVTGFSPLAVAV